MSIDRTLFGRVVTFTGLALLVCIVGLIVLAALNRPLPEVLATIATGILGLLGGLLIHPPASSVPAPVTVENPPTDPVQVTASVDEQAVRFMAQLARDERGRFTRHEGV